MMTQVVILAGGMGMRMGGNNHLPKPLTPIGGRPIIEHIMEIFAAQGFSDFLVALGQGAAQITQHFDGYSKPWAIRFIDTGNHTANASRLLKLGNHLRDEQFFLVWCDGLFDIDLKDMLNFHNADNQLVSVAVVNPVLPYGLFELGGDQITGFQEKPQMDSHWVNAGVSIVSPNILEKIKLTGSSWEEQILPELVEKNQVKAYRHLGFWKSMDTQKDAAELNTMWESGNVVWSNGPYRGRV